MTGFVANTDFNWFNYLRDRSDLDEVNFWRPLDTRQFRVLGKGEPIIFKLGAEQGYRIVGFGMFILKVNLPVIEAWAVFGQANGAPTEPEMWDRLQMIARRHRNTRLPPNHVIGCLLVASPVFFPKELWVDPPTDWSGNTVGGASYDLTRGEGLRIWKSCMERAGVLSLSENARHNLKVMEDMPRYGHEITVKPRLGQGSFRYVLQTVYERCAVTQEHSIPALDAAHIVPYSSGGTHEVPNGVLLRADIHKLFDRGFVTITPDYEFRVSRLLDEQYRNGRVYYELEGSRVWLPHRESERPRKEYLDMHSSEIFLG